VPLRITSQNYGDVSIFAGEFYGVDRSGASLCPVTDAGYAILCSPERNWDSVEIACDIIAFASGDTVNARIGRLVRPARFAGSHHAFEKQFYKPRCNYRDRVESGDARGADGSVAARRDAFPQ
jgi:hypothetical protein